MEVSGPIWVHMDRFSFDIPWPQPCEQEDVAKVPRSPLVSEVGEAEVFGFSQGEDAS